MVRSMTGFGAASREEAGVRVSVEAKSVNGRFLKSHIKLPSSLSRYEPQLESLVRGYVIRGTVNMSVFIEYTDPELKVAVNEEVAKAYHSIFERLGIGSQNIVQLPGVIDARNAMELSDEQWAEVEKAGRSALEALVVMRESEGQKLAEIVRGLCAEISSLKDAIGERSPHVVVEYQEKLKERIESLLQASGTEVDPQVLAREVSIFADRCDIREEVDRIQAHLQQVEEKLAEGKEIGRALDFLAQELLREANTIGSKSADVSITKRVIDLKSEVERFKEQVANIE